MFALMLGILQHGMRGDRCLGNENTDCLLFLNGCWDTVVKDEMVNASKMRVIVSVDVGCCK